MAPTRRAFVIPAPASTGGSRRSTRRARRRSHFASVSSKRARVTAFTRAWPEPETVARRRSARDPVSCPDVTAIGSSAVVKTMRTRARSSIAPRTERRAVRSNRRAASSFERAGQRRSARRERPRAAATERARSSRAMTAPSSESSALLVRGAKNAGQTRARSPLRASSRAADVAICVARGIVRKVGSSNAIGPRRSPVPACRTARASDFGAGESAHAPAAR